MIVRNIFSMNVIKNENNQMLNKDFELIVSGAETVIGQDQLKIALENKQTLRIKLGADPTAPNLHLGHVVVLEKLRDFQKLGHTVIFLIGDFTAQIGDPTGKTKTRQPLLPEVIKKNVETYVSQITKILDKNQLEVVYNSSWFDLFKSQDWIRLTAKVTLAQIVEREDFKKRIEINAPIRMHELLYPLLQAYDSVQLSANVEIGGTDQTFNLLLGRNLQESYSHEKQIVITMPLIEGTDGKVKMSKSLGNEIGLTESSNSVFGKIMSISDSLMYKYFKTLLRYNEDSINQLKKSSPIETKKQLAYLIIEKYWSQKEAQDAFDYFTTVIQKKSFSFDLFQEINLQIDHMYSLFELCNMVDQDISRSQVRRLLFDGAISLNGEKIVSDKYTLTGKEGKEYIFKIGKHKIFKLKFI